MTSPCQFLTRLVLILCVLFTAGITATAAQSGGYDAIDPVAYLNFNEGSGLVAFDASGHGNAGTLFNVSRQPGGCGGALVFDRVRGFASIPFRPSNHPDAITVSLFFFGTPPSGPQDLVSTCFDNGGYCLGYGDAGDLWWTVHTRHDGEVSVNVQHEGIAPGEWHHVVGMYDGKTAKIYLDGSLRNSVNATGPIVYTAPNYVIIGAGAGPYDAPDPSCPRFFHGGVEELRIYDRAIPYTQIMDDRFRCPQELIVPSGAIPTVLPAITTCTVSSGTISLRPDESVTRIVTIPDKGTSGIWHIAVQPGSRLAVEVQDRYQQMNPDSWYIEIADGYGRVDRSIAFPKTHNSPIDGIIRDGNATVTLRYFDGRERFPVSAEVRFSAGGPPPIVPEPPKTILNYPIIVIYSASWATLIALILVFVWLRKRHNEKLARENGKKE